jgi:hypothetical protein
MKNAILFGLSIIPLLFSCTPNENSHENSELTRVDSLFLTDVTLPKVINYLNFDTATIAVFSTLASETDGELYLAENAFAVAESIIEVIEEHGDDNIDLCFLIDKTSSMRDDIHIVHASMDKIFSAIKAYKNVNVALAYYGDKNVDGNNWIELHPFSQDFDAIEKAFYTVSFTGGGDAPESVTDALHMLINNVNWSSTNKRAILVIGDAPSLVPPLSEYTIQDIVEEASYHDVMLNYYPIVVGFDGHTAGPSKKELIASVYPNPSDGIITLVLTEGENYLVEVFNAAGVLVYSGNVTSSKHQIDLTNQKDGLYIIRVLTEGNNEVDKRKVLLRR